MMTDMNVSGVSANQASNTPSEIKIDDKLKNTKLCSIFNAATATARNQEFRNQAKFDTDGNGSIDIDEMKTAIEEIKKDNAKNISKDRYKGAQKGVHNTDEQKQAFNTLSENGHYDWTGRRGENQQAERTEQVNNNKRDAAAASRIMLHSLNSAQINELVELAKTETQNAETEQKIKEKDAEIKKLQTENNNLTDENQKLKAEIARLNEQLKKSQPTQPAAGADKTADKQPKPETASDKPAAEQHSTTIQTPEPKADAKETKAAAEPEQVQPAPQQTTYDNVKKEAEKLVKRNTGTNLAEKAMGERRYQTNISNYIKSIKDPEKQAMAIAAIIDYASDGAGTNDPAFKAAIYSLTKDNYDRVNTYLSKHGKTYTGQGIKTYIEEETSLADKADLIRHATNAQADASPTKMTLSEKDKKDILENHIRPAIKTEHLYERYTQAQEVVTKAIKKLENDPQKQAYMIACLINYASFGPGTRDAMLTAAIYTINDQTYPLVENYLKTLPKGTYSGQGLSTYIDEEMSGDQKADLHRHINQFIKKK